MISLLLRTSLFSPGLILMLFQSIGTPIICCKSAVEVKNAITMFVREGDCVLELGAEFSDVSAHICETIGASGEAILVDKQRSQAKSGRCISRNVERFVIGTSKDSFGDRAVMIELQELSAWKETVLENSRHCNVVVLSVSHILGHDLHITILTWAHEILDCLSTRPPRAMIVKSKTLQSLSRRLVHSQRLSDGTTCLPDNLERCSEPYIIAAVKVEEYRRTITSVVRPTDAIIEVGCHFGRTTDLLNKAGRYCIGIDIGPKIIENARQQYPGIQFAVGDAFKTLDLLKLRQKVMKEDEMGYDVIYADIGGLSGSDGHLESLSLLEALGNALEPRCIVIKSLCTRQLASRLRYFPQIWEKFSAAQS
jgi:2-polyprenyl-3-methyl-5-hydroxy-6-metoxy-1,4-benzoquinol methylase